MKLKIPFDRKKIRIPRIRKLLRIPLVIGTLIILVAMGMYFHLLPGIGSLAHLFDVKVTAVLLSSHWVIWEHRSTPLLHHRSSLIFWILPDTIPTRSPCSSSI